MPTVKKYTVPTGHKHTFRIISYTMTISFILVSSDQVETDYPTYLLESSDGQYQKKFSVRSDLADANDYFQLRFEKLRPGQTYKLTRYRADNQSKIIFEGKASEIIKDQERTPNKALENHGYTEFVIDFGNPIPALSPDDPGFSDFQPLDTGPQLRAADDN